MARKTYILPLLLLITMLMCVGRLYSQTFPADVSAANDFFQTTLTNGDNIGSVSTGVRCTTSEIKLTALITKDMSENVFHWAVYGGTITSFNGRQLNVATYTYQGKKMSFLNVEGKRKIYEYEITVQWDGIGSADNCKVAVLQTNNKMNCILGKWSVMTLSPPSNAVVTVDPTNQSGCSGSNVTFTATATNAVSVAWQYQLSGSSNWVDVPSNQISGDNVNSTFTIQNIEPSDNNTKIRFKAVGCSNEAISNEATLTVASSNTITRSSADGTDAQTACQGSNITPITYATTGATGASFSGLPAGVTGSWTSNNVTISGTPTASGTFNYTVTMTGGCPGETNTASGTITVNLCGSLAVSADNATQCPTIDANLGFVGENSSYNPGATDVTFTVTRTNGVGDWSFNYVLSIDPTSYVLSTNPASPLNALSGTINATETENTKVVQFYITNQPGQPGYTATLTISNPVGASTIETASASIIVNPMPNVGSMEP